MPHLSVESAISSKPSPRSRSSPSKPILRRPSTYNKPDDPLLRHLCPRAGADPGSRTDRARRGARLSRGGAGCASRAIAPCSTARTSGSAPPCASCGRSSRPRSIRRTNSTTRCGPIDWSRVPDAGPHARRRLQRPRFGDHALAVRGPAREGRHLRPVPRTRRPAAERRCRAADGRLQPARLPGPRGPEPR